MRRLRDGRGGSTARPRTPRTLLATFGRLALWLAVGVVLIRGVVGMLAVERPATARHVSRGAQVATWPDDAARAFAVDFVGAYLSHSPTEPGAYTSALGAYAAPELVAELAPRRGDREPRQAVRSATVGGTLRLDDRHALVTVAATLATPGMGRRLVTVPIARDAAAGLAVYDLPSFAAAPPRAATSPPETEPLLGPERPALIDVLTRFLRTYLAGDSAGLAYLVPPGTRIAAAAGRFELIDLTAVNAAGPATRAGRLVLATVQARDSVSGAVYALRYRVRLVRRDRWYVAEINGPGEE